MLVQGFVDLILWTVYKDRNECSCQIRNGTQIPRLSFSGRQEMFHLKQPSDVPQMETYNLDYFPGIETGHNMAGSLFDRAGAGIILQHRHLLWTVLRI